MGEKQESRGSKLPVAVPGSEQKKSSKKDEGKKSSNKEEGVQSGPPSSAPAGREKGTEATGATSHTQVTSQPIAAIKTNSSPPADSKLQVKLKDAARRRTLDEMRQILRGNPGMVNDKIGYDEGTVVHLTIRGPIDKPLGEDESEKLEFLKEIEQAVGKDRVDWNVTDRKLRTPLHLTTASAGKFDEISQFLLDPHRGNRRARPNVINKDGVTPLHQVIDYQSIKMVKALLKNGANPNEPDRKWRTPLHLAAAKGDDRIVDALLRQDGIKTAAVDKREWTPLHQACRDNYYHVAQILLSSMVQGAKEKQTKKLGFTALHMAAEWNAAECVERLLKDNVSRTTKTNEGLTAEEIARKHGKDNIVSLFHTETKREDGTLELPTPPREGVEALCNYKRFRAIFWPARSCGVSFFCHRPSVWEMLYTPEAPSGQPLLRKARRENDAKWIHITSNNIRWVEDVFRAAYWHKPRAQHTTEQDEKGNAEICDEVANTAERDADQADLRNVLNLIKRGFRDVEPIVRRKQPYFKAEAKERNGNGVVAMVIPFIDVDIQQHFHEKSTATKPAEEKAGGKEESKEAQRCKEYATSLKKYLNMLPGLDPKEKHTKPAGELAGGKEQSKEAQRRRKYATHLKEYATSLKKYVDMRLDLDPNEREHVDQMSSLYQTYRKDVRATCTLDEYFHHFMPEPELQERNGSQVVSRYMARRMMAANDWRNKKTKSRAGTSSDSGGGMTDARESDDAASAAEEEGEDISSSIMAMSPVQPMRSPSTPTQLVPRDEIEPASQPTLPLENKRPVVGHNYQATVSVDSEATPGELESQSGLVEPLHQPRRWLGGIHRRRSAMARSSDPTITSKKRHRRKRASSQSSDSRETATKNHHSGGESDEDDDPKLSRKEHQKILVVPQLWVIQVKDLVLTTLPARYDIYNDQSLAEDIRTKVTTATGDPAEMTPDILVGKVLEACSEYDPLLCDGRSYLAAFGQEIADLSSKVALAYDSFKASMGSALDAFPGAVEIDTDHLIEIDDIISEMTMIRKVYEDQNEVRTAWLLSGSKDGQQPPDIGYINGSEDRRKQQQESLKRQGAMSELHRLDENAQWVRSAITTLLDLRQRQATTEHVIETRKQSAEAKKQSDIMFRTNIIQFIFAFVTVIFSPLSWVASLMALKIGNFTNEDEIWTRGQVGAASTASVVATIVLCFLGIYFYYKLELEPNRADDARQNQGDS